MVGTTACLQKDAEIHLRPPSFVPNLYLNVLLYLYLYLVEIVPVCVGFRSAETFRSSNNCKTERWYTFELLRQDTHTFKCTTLCKAVLGRVFPMFGYFETPKNLVDEVLKSN